MCACDKIDWLSIKFSSCLLFAISSPNIKLVDILSSVFFHTLGHLLGHGFLLREQGKCNVMVYFRNFIGLYGIKLISLLFILEGVIPIKSCRRSLLASSLVSLHRALFLKHFPFSHIGLKSFLSSGYGQRFHVKQDRKIGAFGNKYKRFQRAISIPWRLSFWHKILMQRLRKFMTSQNFNKQGKFKRKIFAHETEENSHTMYLCQPI